MGVEGASSQDAQWYTMAAEKVCVQSRLSFIMPALYKDFLSQKLDLKSALPWCLNSSPHQPEVILLQVVDSIKLTLYLSLMQTESCILELIEFNYLLTLLHQIHLLKHFPKQIPISVCSTLNTRGRMVSLYHLKYNTFLYINSRDMKIFGHNSIVE